MGFNDRAIYLRPTETEIHVTREPVADRVCPECGSGNIARYPIGWVRGPRIAVKCQDCLCALEIQRPGPDDAWPPFRAVAYDWEASPSERTGADGAGRD